MKLTQRKNDKPKVSTARRMSLAVYDALVLLLVDLLILVIYPSSAVKLDFSGVLAQIFAGAGCVFACRALLNVYGQIWRYGGTRAYIQLMAADTMAGLAYYGLNRFFSGGVTFIRALSIIALNLLCCIGIRMIYQFLYQNASQNSRLGSVMREVVRVFTGLRIEPMYPAGAGEADRKIRVAIVGAGRVGVMFAEELLNNPTSAYQPRCFIDIDREKIGRRIFGLSVLSEEEATPEMLEGFAIQEIVLALPRISSDKKKSLYEHYKQTGCKVKIYDYPTTHTLETGKCHLREFQIEDLLFRKEMEFTDMRTAEYYRGKTVLISGGGGSIGSELCRQIAKMQPKRLVVLDIYENGAYDVQQELKIAYGDRLNLDVEIVSVCDRAQLEKVFATYRPEIVLHAAAHKHVPLMEHNCCEAVYNNVFGTLNIVECAEKYRTQKFIMISTDKAVNPTNVMGATKRMCEMIVQSRKSSATCFSATRFGNVLGSNGSVIPLFKRQIANGSPVTITDKRIIRYFMTIPEASQLVLASGAMARNGELYVLDMGKPIKIMELAENMIRMAGYEPERDIRIVETGLRPGEKLYEELLIKTEELDKTENELIFIERDEPLEAAVVEEKLLLLKNALRTGEDAAVRGALMNVVPTYHTPEEVNKNAVQAEEMKRAAC